MSKVYRSLQGQVKRETEKAVLFVPHRPDGQLEEELWFPLSQISSIHKAYDEINGTFDIIMASEWILGVKGVLSISGAAGVNPITAANVVKPNPASHVNTPRDMKYNRLPYKDDESPVYEEDDIPF